MINKSLAAFLLAATMLMPACIPLVDLYLVAEGGYQRVKAEQPAGNPDVEGHGFTYGGGLGLGLSILRLYAGVEANIVLTTFDDILNDVTSDGSGVTAKLQDKWILTAVGDVGIYLSKDWLLFGRAGYVYVDTDVDRSGSDSDLDSLKDDFSAFAFGGGIEHEIGLGLGVRTYYLYHEGRRNAHDLRAGIIWRF